MGCSGGKIVFNPTEFREMFPEFSDVVKFPNAMLQMKFDLAECYINNNCALMGSKCLKNALYLMTAHLVQISVIIARGQTSVILKSATIDKVSVSVAEPPTKNNFQWWLNTTPYGAQLHSLLQGFAVGGFMFGGLPEREAIRKVYGTFQS